MTAYLSSFPVRVLFVEDNHVNRRIILKQLELLKCQATTVVNGLEAVKFCREQTVDLILMDCLMPVMDGYEATKQIRQDHLGQNRSTAIIGVTAQDFMSEHRRGEAAGMNDILVKPIFLKDLKMAIAKWAQPIIL